MKNRIKSIYILGCALALIACGSQQDAFMAEKQPPPVPASPDRPIKVATDEKAETLPTQEKLLNGHLYGEVTQEDLLQSPFASWFETRKEAHIVNETALPALKKGLNGKNLRVYMGSWCGDSKREIPKLYKILEEINFDMDNLTMIAVARGKKEPAQLVEGYNLLRVPTIIVYDQDVELGRFVESARESLEEDLVAIIKQTGYKHKYDN